MVARGVAPKDSGSVRGKSFTQRDELLFGQLDR